MRHDPTIEEVARSLAELMRDTVYTAVLEHGIPVQGVDEKFISFLASAMEYPVVEEVEKVLASVNDGTYVAPTICIRGASAEDWDKGLV